ncbi:MULTISPECIES: hypothetical protein [unclassified Halobacteriovorax]|uniref:hypothetical protein n=1 Tax=unclassified Halobacteriovorax TaxID=2639665 RepID=UPI00399B8BA8
MQSKKHRNKPDLISKSINTKKTFYKMDNPFEGLSLEERKHALNSIGERSKENFENSITELDKIFTENDPLQLLAMLSYYELTTSVSDSGIKYTDFEAAGINQFHPEFCQAYILRDNKYNHSKLVKHDTYSKMRETLTILSFSLHFQGYSAEKLELTEAEHAIEGLRRKVLGHTQIVRNWGYINQVKEITKSLFSELDELYYSSLGFTASQVIQFFEALLEMTETKLNARLQSLSILAMYKNKAELVKSYHVTILGQDEEKAEDFINSEMFKQSSLKQIRAMLLSHQDLFLKDIYAFDTSSIAEFLEWNVSTIENLVEVFSFSFGDLNNSRIDYIINDNPIWGKPLIKSDNNIFYCFTPQVFFSFALRTLTVLAEPFAKKQIERRRATFLENRIEEIVKEKFPENKTFKSIKWKYDNREYETDLITSIDTCLLIIEAKSGRITPSALRGAPGRLKTHLKEIIISPNQQSMRLKNKIFAIKRGEEDSEELENQLDINLKSISKVIRLSVSLEDFAMIQSNVKQHEKTGWLPSDFSPCPSMNIADFDTLFKLFDHPLGIIHYLSRREEIEEYVKFHGDELDLMGYYIKTLFDSSCFPNDENFFLNLDGESKTVDHYFDSLAHGIKLKKPEPILTPFWKSLITKLEERNFENWTQIGITLLHVAPDDQKKVIKKLADIKKNVRKNWHKEGHINMLVWCPPDVQDTSMVFLFFCKNNWPERDKLIQSATNHGLSEKHIKKCVVFAINIDAEDRPYDLVGMFLKE